MSQVRDSKLLIFSSLFISLLLAASANGFVFRTNYVDLDYGGNGRPGWVRSADMDGDGDIDLVAGGGRALFIYENNGNGRSWKRYGNLDSSGKMGANGAILFDVNRDGNLDVVSATYYDDIGWWENPGAQFRHRQWRFHSLFKTRWFLHDLICTDLDRDGHKEEFIANLNNKYWGTDIKILWFRLGKSSPVLQEMHFVEPGRNEGSLHCHAGLDTGDLDRDGVIDIAFSNGWYESPATKIDPWVWHPVADVYGISNCLLRDMDLDADLDLVVSAGHHGNGVYWYENPSLPKTPSWNKHVVDDSIKNPEGLAVVDMNGDGDLDVVACELDFNHWNQKLHSVYVFEPSNKSSCWTKHNIAPKSFPSHQLQVIDINKDGRLDIISEGAGYKVVTYFENISSVHP